MSSWSCSSIEDAKDSLRRKMKIQCTPRAEHLGVFTLIKRENVRWFKSLLVKSISPHWGEEKSSGMLVSAPTKREGGGDCLFASPSVCVRRRIWNWTSVIRLQLLLFLNHKLFFFPSELWYLLLLSATRAAAAVEAHRRGSVPAEMWLRTDIFFYWQSMCNIQQTEMFILNVSAAWKSPW